MGKTFFALLFKQLQERMGSKTLTDERIEYYKNILEK